MSTRHPIWQLIRTVWIAAGLSATVVFVMWSILAYRAAPAAVAAMASDSLVAVENGDAQITFTPRKPRSGAATFVFFPGALVDPRAYAPLGRSVAGAGFPVVVVKLPGRGAFGGAESPELDRRIAAALGNGVKQPVVAGGHSRGAVVASRLAALRPRDLSGLVIIGTSHPRDHDLSTLAIPVTKIVGTRDGLASPDEVRQNSRLLPAHTQWIWIEGGNHSQFGWYGFQPLDRRPRIDGTAQRRVMIQGILDLLQVAKVGAPPSDSQPAASLRGAAVGGQTQTP